MSFNKCYTIYLQCCLPFTHIHHVHNLETLSLSYTHSCTYTMSHTKQMLRIFEIYNTIIKIIEVIYSPYLQCETTHSLLQYSLSQPRFSMARLWQPDLIHIPAGPIRPILPWSIKMIHNITHKSIQILCVKGFANNCFTLKGHGKSQFHERKTFIQVHCQLMIIASNLNQLSHPIHLRPFNALSMISKHSIVCWVTYP